jgi:hypothetical protein
LFSRVFRVFLALLVAVPFGAGGLCCCLFAESSPELAAAPAPSCCAGETAPVERPSCPEPGGEECECPARDVALLAKPAPDAGVLPDVPIALLPALSGTPAGEIHDTHAGPAVRRNLHPPPKARIYRTLCAILC